MISTEWHDVLMKWNSTVWWYQKQQYVYANLFVINGK